MATEAADAGLLGQVVDDELDGGGEQTAGRQDESRPWTSTVRKSGSSTIQMLLASSSRARAAENLSQPGRKNST